MSDRLNEMNNCTKDPNKRNKAVKGQQIRTSPDPRNPVYSVQ